MKKGANMKKTALGFIAAAMTFLANTVLADIGAIRSIDPCDQYGNRVAPGTIETAKTVGETAYFRIRLQNKNSAAIYQTQSSSKLSNPWRFEYFLGGTPDYVAQQWAMTPPKVGVYVSGRFTLAEIVSYGEVRNEPWFTDIICGYTVKPGDVWSAIAEDNGMTNQQLLTLNPGYDIAVLHAGDQLTISNAVPYLTVVNVERQRYVQDVAYQVEYTDDASMYQGEYKTTSPGVYGKADITANVTYINGEETEREVVASVTLSQPVTEQQLRGTKERPTWYPTGSFGWPCNGSITSRFGYRNLNLRGASNYHKGIDIANRYGTSIYASDGGTVTYSGWMSGYGYLIIIDHGNGYQTYYGHNSSLVASKGEKVHKGQLIARMGSTGRSTGNHCHFGIKLNGTFLNPLNYL